jgi:DNA-binding MarR family transcriptional regulator
MIEQYLSRVTRLLAPRRPPQLDPVAFRLTLAQGRCLWNIAHHEGCTLHELSERLEVRPSTSSELVERLVRIGLVQRDTDLCDRRNIRLTLTSKGRAVHSKHKAMRHAHLQDFLDTLTPMQRTDLLNALETLDRVLEQVEPKS